MDSFFKGFTKGELDREYRQGRVLKCKKDIGITADNK